MLKVSEVFQKQIKTYCERPDGSEYANFKKVYETRDLLLNPAYVVSAREYLLNSASELELAEGRFPPGTKFTALVLAGNSFRTSELIVVGSFDKLSRQLGGVSS